MNALKKLLGYGVVAGAAISSALVIVTSTGVTVEDADVTNVSTANGYFLTSAFGILKFLGAIAVLAGGMYVLDKIFGFIPHRKA